MLFSSLFFLKFQKIQSKKNLSIFKDIFKSILIIQLLNNLNNQSNSDIF